MRRHTLFRLGAILTVLTLVAGPLSLLGNVTPVRAAFGDRITVSGTQFLAGGKRIWINGANTPWHSWNDFGGSFDYNWWDNHFKQLHDNGINATRVWITCNGEVGINISDSGQISGATQAHWNNLDSLFQIAQSRQVYIMATLMSFDHFSDSHTNYPKWRSWLTNSSNIDSYVSNYLIPFLNRYKNNPWLWSVDLMNEPDWVYENSNCGNISWDWLQTYFAKASRAVHENSSVLVTVGIGMIKYNSATCPGAQGDKVSDSALQAKVNDPDARLDFYSPHYYPWQDPYFGIPFYKTPGNYGLETGKPAVVGECPAVGSTGHTITQDYENAYQNGWQGVMPWTSNGVDSNGSLTDMGPATRAFRDNHYELVFPSGATSKVDVIYDDAFRWSANWSWGTTVNFNNTSPVYAGSKSMALTYNQAWAGFQALRSSALNTSGYSQITFWVHGGSSGTRRLWVFIYTSTSSAESPKVNVDAPARRWTQVSVPLSSLGNPTQIARVAIQDRSGGAQPIFYVDDLKIVGP